MPNKDPAFLFYPSDYMLGTMLMTYEQKGKYMDLLCLLHSKDGYLTKKQMQTVLNFDSPEDKDILEKFDCDENGYYNERLLKEIKKRKKHKEKQRENVMRRWHPEDFEDEDDNTQDNTQNNTAPDTKDSYSKDASNKENNTQDNKQKTNNKKEKTTKRFKKPTIEEIENYCKDRKNNIDAEYFYDFYESKNWMIGKNKMKSWKAAVRTWEKNSFNQINTNTKIKSKKEENISGVKVDDDEFDWDKRYGG